MSTLSTLSSRSLSLTTIANRPHQTVGHAEGTFRLWNDEATQTFPLLLLPPELLNPIYASYFSSLPPVEVTHINATSNHWESIPLSISSPILQQSINPSTFYANITFSFSSPAPGSTSQPSSLSVYTLEAFASSLASRSPKLLSSVNKIRLNLTTVRQKNPDWVHLIFTHFQGITELTFVLETGSVECCLEFECWWAGVRDAVREAVGASKGEKEVLLVAESAGPKGLVLSAAFVGERS